MARIKRNKLIQKSVCMLESEWQAIEEESEMKDVTQSWLIRSIVKKYINGGVDDENRQMP